MFIVNLAEKQAKEARVVVANKSWKTNLKKKNQ